MAHLRRCLRSESRVGVARTAPLGISANALRAGVTDTPAARKIPGSDRMFERALEFNPGGRLTTPEDVADVLVALSLAETTWLSGNVIGIDGGEDLAG